MDNAYAQVKDEVIKEKALELIASEEDLKYRKKYMKLCMNWMWLCG
jgi:hypothetical protein